MIKAKYDWMYNFPLNKYKLRGEYRSYIANLDQVSTNAPTALVFKDDFGDISYSYSNVGEYFLLSQQTPFLFDKTYILIGSNKNGSGGYATTIYADRNDDSQIKISTASSFTASDDILYNTTLEIRVYY